MKFYLSALAMLALSSCAYFEVDEQARLAAQNQKPQPQTVAVQAVPVEPDMNAMIRSQSDGQVEFFSLDAPVSPVAVPSANADQVSSVPTAGDPSVTVFSLDDAVPSSGTGSSSLPPMNVPGAVSLPSSPANVIFFERSGSGISDDDRLKIDSVVRTIPAGPITVEGFASMESDITDPVRRKIVNLQMSMDRALAVSGYLIESGLPAERIITIARGETVAGPNDAESRRVEIRGVTGQ